MTFEILSLALDAHFMCLFIGAVAKQKDKASCNQIKSVTTGVKIKRLTKASFAAATREGTQQAI
jgi:hypothetical protein